MTRVSAFGTYHGYSTERFDRVVRSSQYLPLRDGVEVAADIFRPATEAGPVTEPLPVILLVTRYWRSRESDTGSIYTPLGVFGPGQDGVRLNTADIGFNEPSRPLHLHRLAANGYLVVVVENRGTGASFGRMGEAFRRSADESEDAALSGARFLGGLDNDLYDMVEWCAAQDFCDGRVAMSGASWLGWMQLAGAAANPPSLLACFPRVPSALHTHRISHFGGVFFKGAMVTMGRTMIRLAETGGVQEIGGIRFVGPPPVDDDLGGERRAAARAGHFADSFESYFATTIASEAGKELFARLGITDHLQQIETMFSVDQLDKALQGLPEVRDALLHTPLHDTDVGADFASDMQARMTASGTPMYFWDGWRDPHPHDRLVMWANHGAPKRLTIGPWAHGPLDPFDQREKDAERILAAESLRWYDRWVKEIDNGIDTEPSLAFCAEAAGPRWQWHHADTWPLPTAEPVVWSLAAGPSGTLDVGNDGVLTREAAEPGADTFAVDYSATTGPQTTYHSAAGGGAIDLPDMRLNDTKGLAYTSTQLDRDLTVAGTPVFHLHVRADAADATFVVHVEEVLPDGRCHLVKQGFLRASHRTLRELPYNNLGVPFPSSLRADVEATTPLDEGIAELVIPTEPMVHTFGAGSRIRVTITGADEGVILCVPEEQPPTITLLRDAGHPSRVVLPTWAPTSARTSTPAA